jgi:hypothetical protein
VTGLALMGAIELLLLIAVLRRIKENRRLRDELRKCHADLAAALAHVAGGEILPARRLLTRWPATGTRPRPPPLPGNEPGGRLH